MRELNIREFYEGMRVELNPSTDLWMRGARYGFVKTVDIENNMLVVRMDLVRGLERRLHAMRPRAINPRSADVTFMGWRGR